MYPNSNVLINRLNIQDEQELITIEAQLLIAGILDIQAITNQIDFRNSTSLQTIHQYLFQELYAWAGKFRTINIYKSERVLNGLSITYSNKSQIQSDLNTVFNWANTVTWSPSDPQLAFNFSKFMTELWRVHPFREGNTRTVSIFIKLFTEAKGIEFDEQLLSQNAGYLRNALVLAAVEEAPEPEHLYRMITDALGSTITDPVIDDSPLEKYQSIGQYDVSNYEEKPFTTESYSERNDE